MIQRRYLLCGLIMAGLLSVAAKAEMELMPDQELQTVDGQQGIALGLDYYINANSSGAPLASLSNCSGLLNPCRMGVQVAGRTGEWLVVKDAYATLHVDTVRLDSGLLGSAGSSTITFDDTRFRNPSGTCLLAGGSCTTASIDAINALALTVPTTALSYNPATKISAGYTNMQLGANIGRLAVEFDTGSPVTLGYNRDVNGSFVGLRIADNNSNLAGISFMGKAYVYGF